MTERTYDDIKKWAEELPAGPELDALVAEASGIDIPSGETWAPSLRWGDAMLAATATELFGVKETEDKYSGQSVRQYFIVPNHGYCNIMCWQSYATVSRYIGREPIANQQFSTAMWAETGPLAISRLIVMLSEFDKKEEAAK